ncbi:MAG: biopolymer transporter ExbD [Symploca sp. SIO2C1]|nr:biopolymer transporter ExbD [Symploca sp. SIO2C1]
MRFKNQQTGPSMPAIDLIPMLNVMMSVLAFFVMLTTTLTNEEGVDIQLPNAGSEEDTETQNEQQDSLIVQLNSQGQIVVREQILNKEQLASQMQAYLQENAQGTVQLVADPQASYEKVVQLLGEMKGVGSDRVSLAIDTD